MYKIIVSGYYGFNNIGDEAILKGVVEGIRRELPDTDIVVLSRYPDFTMQKHPVRSINRMNPFSILKEMKDADLILSGGGSLLQDVTSKRSILYYLSILFLGKSVFHKKVMLYSQGIGPINKERNRRLAKKILSRVDLINVRDKESRDELRALGVDRPILVTTDTVFGIEKASPEVGNEILHRYESETERLNIGITVIHWKNYDRMILDECSKMMRRIAKGREVNFFLIPLFYYRDLDMLERLQEECKDIASVHLIREYLHVEEYLSLIANMDIMVSMRLHGLIFAATMGAYPIGISYDPKVQGFMKEMERDYAVTVEELDGEVLAAQIEDAMEHLDTYGKQTEQQIAYFYQLSKIHNQAVRELLENEGNDGTLKNIGDTR